MERFVMDGSAAASVDAYAEYRRIVGNADGGRLFSQQEYEDFKEKRRREGTLPPPLHTNPVPEPPKMTEQDVMDVYEKRYQARRKAEREQGRGGGRTNYAISLNAPPIALMDMLHQQEFDCKQQQQQQQRQSQQPQQSQRTTQRATRTPHPQTSTRNARTRASAHSVDDRGRGTTSSSSSSSSSALSSRTSSRTSSYSVSTSSTKPQQDNLNASPRLQIFTTSGVVSSIQRTRQQQLQPQHQHQQGQEHRYRPQDHHHQQQHHHHHHHQQQGQQQRQHLSSISSGGCTKIPVKIKLNKKNTTTTQPPWDPKF